LRKGSTGGGGGGKWGGKAEKKMPSHQKLPEKGVAQQKGTAPEQEKFRRRREGSGPGKRRNCQRKLAIGTAIEKGRPPREEKKQGDFLREAWP